jgi:hypothetical protein
VDFVEHFHHVFESLGVREVIGLAYSVELSEVNGFVLSDGGFI